MSNMMEGLYVAAQGSFQIFLLPAVLDIHQIPFTVAASGRSSSQRAILPQPHLIKVVWLVTRNWGQL